MTETPVTPARKKPRSPSYPGIDLETALTKAAAVFREEQRHAANVDTLYGHWGNKPGSGAGGITLAALKKFGLMVDEGSGDARRARLTDEALAILLDEPDSPARWEAIKAAALLPGIHTETWEKYGGSLPSDANLRSWLIREKAFTTGGADDFINQLRRTVSYAKLGSSDRLPKKEPTPSDEAQNTMPAATATRSAPPAERPPEANQRAPESASRPAQGHVVQLPLVGAWATLDAPFPLTEEAWNLMITVLNAMKPGLVRKDETDEGELDAD